MQMSENSELKDSERCTWAGNDPLYIAYHDLEWGKQGFDDRRLFEFLTLESAQAGLSWITILKKRDAYKRAFHDFDYKLVARMTPQDIERLMNDSGIVRHRGKIMAAISNAALFAQIIDKFGSFEAYVRTFLPDGELIVNSITDMVDLPTRSTVSDAMSKDMKKRGFKYFGTKICYSFLEATGFIDDHFDSCPCKSVK